MSPAWKRALRLILALLFGVITMAGAVVPHLIEATTGRSGADFDDFYYAAKTTLVEGRSIYDFDAMNALARREHGRSPLPVYAPPPFSALAFAPFMRVPVEAARIAWQLLSLVCLAAAVAALAALIGDTTGRRVDPLAAFGFFSLAAAGFGGCQDHLWQGQTSLLCLALITWGLVLLLRGGRWREAAAAGLFAAAVLTKVYPGIFLPFLLVDRRWRVVGLTGVASLLLIAASLPLVRLDDYLGFAGHLTGTFYTGEGLDWVFNFSFKHALLSWLTSLGASDLAKAWSGRLLLLPYLAVLGAAALATRTQGPTAAPVKLALALRCAGSFLFLGLVMSSVWDHHLVLILAPLALLLAVYRLEPRQWSGHLVAWALGLSLVGTPVPLLRALPGHPPDTLVPVLRMAGLALLIVLIELTLWRLRSTPRPLSGAEGVPV